MALEQETGSDPKISQGPRRPPRRPGRGRRGRGRGRRPPPEPAPGGEAVPNTEVLPAEAGVAGGSEVEQEPTAAFVPEESPPPRAFRAPAHPAAPASVQEAIAEVNRIIEQLKESLDDMEEVLETLELAERQKTADEREIETLRRSLRHMHRPREEGRGHPPGSAGSASPG